MTQKEYEQLLEEKRKALRKYMELMNKAKKHEREQARKRQMIECAKTVSKAKEVIELYGLNVRTKERETVNKRKALMYWLAIFTPMNYKQIAELFDMSVESISYAIATINKVDAVEKHTIFNEMNQYKCSPL